MKMKTYTSYILQKHTHYFLLLGLINIHVYELIKHINSININTVVLSMWLITVDPKLALLIPPSILTEVAMVQHDIALQVARLRFTCSRLISPVKGHLSVY